MAIQLMKFHPNFIRSKTKTFEEDLNKIFNNYYDK